MDMVKMILFLAFSFFLQEALGGIICEQLPPQLCSYSVSASGKRCLLENFAASDGTVTYQCKTSEVVVDVIHDWIETDECINDCGIDRKSVGISSDSLIYPQFTAKLCSDACHQNCPNIVDLYFNLDLGEGVYLSNLCQAQQTNPRRAMSDIKSSGEAWSPAPSPTGYFEAWVPVPSPSGSGEASSLASSSTGYGEAWSPAPSPTDNGEVWSPAPSPADSGEAWEDSMLDSSSNSQAWSPSPSPTGYAWAPTSSSASSSEAWVPMTPGLAPVAGGQYMTPGLAPVGW